MEIKNNVIGAVVLVLIGMGAGYVITTTTKSGHTCPMKMDHSSMSMSDTMKGMMGSLEGKKGVELERAFLDEMIVHHEGAVDMARALKSGTNRPELVKLAEDITTAQTKEIQMMKEWRKQWFNQ